MGDLKLRFLKISKVMIIGMLSILSSVMLTSSAFADMYVSFKKSIGRCYVYNPIDVNRINSENRIGTFKNIDKEKTFKVVSKAKNEEGYFKKCSEFYKLENLGWVCSSVLVPTKEYKNPFDGLNANNFIPLPEKKNQNVKDDAFDKDHVKITPSDKKDEYHNIRSIINRNDAQTVFPGNRTFIALSKNYISRINSKKKITKVIFPQNQHIQLDKSDFAINIKFGNDVPDKYIVDFIIECGNIVYTINAAVDSALPSQIVTLDIKETDEDKAVQQQDLSAYQDSINQASALPEEIKIAKILERVYSNDYLGYWSKRNTAYGDVISTSISNIFVLDHVFDSLLTEESIIDFAKNHIVGKLIGYGQVEIFDGKSRVLFLYKKLQ
jgi:hypothetical protein